MPPPLLTDDWTRMLSWNLRRKKNYAYILYGVLVHAKIVGRALQLEERKPALAKVPLGPRLPACIRVFS